MTTGKRHALLWSPLFLFLVAFALHAEPLFVMFATLALLAPVSYLVGRWKQSGLVVERQAPSVMTAGERANVSVTVRNHGRFRQSLVVVRDVLPPGLASPQGAQVVAENIPPGGETVLQYTLLAERRGVYQVGPPILEAFDYLGLYQFFRRCGPKSELLVYPRPGRIPDLWPLPIGDYRSQRPRQRRRAPSIEFYGVRDYQVGDDLRRVDWKTTARRNKLTVVETEQTQTMEVVIVLDLCADVHAGYGERSTLEYAVNLGASLVEQALKRGFRVGLVAEEFQDRSVPVGGGLRQRSRLMEALARVEAKCQRGLALVVAKRERSLPPGCTVAVISPATDLGLVRVAARLRSLRHPVLWFALDPWTFGNEVVEELPLSLPLDQAALVSGLAAQGVRVVPISGQRSLEANFRETLVRVPVN